MFAQPDSRKPGDSACWQEARRERKPLRPRPGRPGSPAPSRQAPPPPPPLRRAFSGRALLSWPENWQPHWSRLYGHGLGAGGGGRLAAAVRRAAGGGLRVGPAPGPRAGGGGPRGARLALLRRPGALRTGKCSRPGPPKRRRSPPPSGSFPPAPQGVSWKARGRVGRPIPYGGKPAEPGRYLEAVVLEALWPVAAPLGVPDSTESTASPVVPIPLANKKQNPLKVVISVPCYVGVILSYSKPLACLTLEPAHKC